MSMALHVYKDTDEGKLTVRMKKDDSIQLLDADCTKVGSSLKMLQHDAMQGLDISFAISHITMHQY